MSASQNDDQQKGAKSILVMSASQNDGLQKGARSILVMSASQNDGPQEMQKGAGKRSECVRRGDRCASNGDGLASQGALAAAAHTQEDVPQVQASDQCVSTPPKNSKTNSLTHTRACLPF